MKKTSIFLFLLCIAGVSFAQNERYSQSVDTTRTRGEHNVGWLKSHIADNWTMHIQGGGNLYYGFEDTKGKFKDHLGGKIELSLGRWIFPVVGINLNAGLAHAYGFITSDSYLQHRGDLLKDYGHCEGNSTSIINVGGTPVSGSLGGYFWTMEDNPNLLIQDWRYLYVGANLMVNLSYMKPYDKVDFKSRFNHIVYFGYNVRIGLSEENPEKFSNFFGYSTLDTYRGLKNTNFANEGHLGYILKFALNENLNIHTDLRLSLMEGDFDRERIPNVEFLAPDLEFSFMGGITYDFNLRSEEKRLAYYVSQGVVSSEDKTMPKFITYVQVEDVDLIQKIDSLLIVQIDTIDDIRTINYKKELLSTRNQLIEQINSIPTATPLETILSKRLLPFEMVFFELDKWGIQPTEEMKIAKMARIMKAFPDYTFTLYGSADSKTGTVKRNDFLSHQRADTVFNKLVQEYGIPASQLRREYLGGILDYDPFPLNRATVIIMDHPAVRRAFDEIRAQRKAGGGVADF